MNPTHEIVTMTETTPPSESVVTPNLNIPQDKPRPKKTIVLSILVLLLVVVGFLGAALLSRKTVKQVLPSSPIVPTSSQDQVKVIGVFRTAAFNTQQQNWLGLEGVQYQVTDFAGPVSSDNLQGYYLQTQESQNINSDLVGKCVEVTGTIPSPWKVRDIAETYSRSALSVDAIHRVDYSQCSPYKTVDENSNQDLAKITLKGQLLHGVRPAPDIGYDYEMALTEPYLDNESASGLPTELNRVVVAPPNSSLWIEFENNINQEVTIEAYVKWGYSESKYFEVTKILAVAPSSTTETAPDEITPKDANYYKDDYHKIGMSFPAGWSKTVKTIEGFPTIILSSGTSVCGAPKIYIGSDQVFSSSGALCANEGVCEKSGVLGGQLVIAGQDLSKVPVYHAGGIPNQSKPNDIYCERYIAQGAVTTLATSPFITVVYQNEAEKAEILSILNEITQY